ncbi:MAG: sulfide/dihydroorotate dehydrogenase-like FAD/NAD-binding protein, partial [Treponema sp.]|nr:sulfide/dihydroorotate dehydrogenase-like FAD/NAD-binding protein [Treponema sp.]
MFKILEKRKLCGASATWYMRVEAPEIARNRKAGQFIILQVDAEFGERIPLTIADANAEEGWIALAFQAVGATTMKLAEMNEGDELAALLGPLGNPS